MGFSISRPSRAELLRRARVLQDELEPSDPRHAACGALMRQVKEAPHGELPEMLSSVKERLGMDRYRAAARSSDDKILAAFLGPSAALATLISVAYSTVAGFPNMVEYADEHSIRSAQAFLVACACSVGTGLALGGSIRARRDAAKLDAEAEVFRRVAG